jgi:Mrp family chromosome partitioning ATPase
MGRMFRIITEGSLDYPNGGPAAAVADDPFPAGSAPYIEVGGPAPVYSGLPKPAPRAIAAEPPRPQPAPVAVPADDRYLSVAFHQVAPRPAEPTGPAVHPDVVAFHHPEHPVSGEYRSLADDLRKQVGAEPGVGKAVLLTSAGSDNGTTTVLLNLAVTLAREPGARVLVVDADLDRPTAAGKMGLSDIPGLSEVLAQSMPLAWVLQPTVVPRLQLLGCGKPTDATGPAMAADLPRLVTQLRQWFDWVLVDGGVWGDRPQRDATGPAFDGVYLVTRQSDLDRPVFHATRAQVARQGGLLRGFITTRA